MPVIVRKPPLPPEPITGLDWPGNTGVEADTVRLDWMGAARPQIAPLTIIRKFFPKGPQPTGYNTICFYCDVQDLFSSDQQYWGAHQYPQNFGAGPEPRHWEISIQGDDDITDDNGNSTDVINNTWVDQAIVVTNSGADEILVTFYYDIAAGFNHVITWTTTNGWRSKTPTNPGFVWGDAPWSKGNEMMNGILRGNQWYEAALNTTQIGTLRTLEYDSQVLTTAAGLSLNPFYLRMNPTPSAGGTDDQSGNDNHPTGWFNSNRPDLWTA